MLSEKIKYYRKANFMSQDELAEKLNVSRQSVSLWENGQSQPTLENIMALTDIFGVTSDELLGKTNNSKVSAQDMVPDEKKKSPVFVIITALIILIIILIAAIITLQPAKGEKSTDNAPIPIEQTVDQTLEKEQVQDNEKALDTTAFPQEKEEFDLFEYCKEFAIRKGNVNGDHTIYQQPSTLYGGYENEYFSISYWGDSNMVEFCLHCPLNDTFSINFYLRMRGGFDGKYEYLASKYYRSDGTSLRSASGYINPSVFSDNYPLNCDSYIGSTDGQNEFMEESRVGICDLIYCLKEFVAVEEMECTIDDFGFENY